MSCSGPSGYDHYCATGVLELHKLLVTAGLPVICRVAEHPCALGTEMFGTSEPLCCTSSPRGIRGTR